jgi:hypothetical protein
VRGAQADMLSYTEGNHIADAETVAAVSAAAEQGAQAMQGELPSRQA